LTGAGGKHDAGGPLFKGKKRIVRSRKYVRVVSGWVVSRWIDDNNF
jgi:hypothetical protein